ncbi:MAG: hypothetical protein DWQ01_05245 [Planctomycetota bacterium]|nr:MAG: hypothetical protein DWQ01_05245 [Planctomycetota bacterium]
MQPKYAGVYRMATGELLPQKTSSRSSVELLFNNRLSITYYGILYIAAGPGQELVDEGIFRDRGLSSLEQIQGFEISYCSSKPDPTGNSGEITICFYDETIVCQGPVGGGNYANAGYLCAYDLVGLPLGSPNGVTQCWTLDVDLRQGWECPSELASQTCSGGSLTTDEAAGKQFGWSFIAKQENTGPIGAVCSDTGYGADNSFVWFDDLGSYIGCFWFGSCLPSCSFAIKIFGYDADSKAYRSCSDGGFQDIQLDSAPAGPSSRTFTILNPDPQREYWLIGSLGASDRYFAGQGYSLLLDPLASSSPPIWMPAGTLTIPSLPSGIYHFQAAATSGLQAPSFSNPPTSMSHGWQEQFP